MDTRTVISGIPFDRSLNVSLPYEIRDSLLIKSFKTDMFLSAIEKETGLYTFDDILNWMTALKCKYDLNIHPVSLFEINQWNVTDREIHHTHNNYFKVIAVEVEIGNREVRRWTQPLIEPVQIGLIAFIVKKINNVFHFLVQAKLECGNFDILEMAPTVQCLTGGYTNSKDLPFLDTVLNARIGQIRYNTLQSEEGGRFFKEQNRNMIIEVDEDFPVEIPENYIWATLSQLNTFLRFNNFLNIQARSLISAINFI